MEEHLRILAEIKARVNPKLMVLFGTKKNMVTDKVRDIDVCIVTETEDKTRLEHDLYLAIDSEVSFDILIYTPEEWDVLVSDPQSYAHRILEKGTVVYEG